MTLQELSGATKGAVRSRALGGTAALRAGQGCNWSGTGALIYLTGSL